jgi:hypothetical protein
MKSIRQGLTYNTETATMIGVGCRQLDAEWNLYARFTLFQTRGADFFSVDEAINLETNEVRGNAFLSTWTCEEARQLVLKSELPFDWTADANIFNRPVRKDSTFDGLTVHIRMPRSHKERIETRAREAGMSLNAWIMRCTERAALDTSATQA